MKLTRRHFLQAGLGASAAVALAACAPKPAPAPEPAAQEQPTAQEVAQATEVPPTEAPAAEAPGATSTPNANYGLEDIKRLSDSKVTLRGWAGAMDNPVADVKTFNDQIFFKKMEELTNVRIEWQHASLDPNVDSLALLMAGGDLPDFICGVSLDRAAIFGMQGALAPLNELFACCTPWFNKLTGQFPALLGDLTVPDGNIYAFPRAFTERSTAVFAGVMIRQDWLEEVGMPVPETTDDYYETLKAFKAKDANRYPLTWDPRWLIWQWGVGSQGPNCYTDFYREGESIKYGPIQPEFGDALAYINKLFTEGLLDPEYLQTMAQGDFLTTRMTTGVSGTMLGWGGSHFSPFAKALSDSDPKAKLVGIMTPKGPTGVHYVLSNHGLEDVGMGGCIGKSSQNQELIAQYIDLYYSPSGKQLMHWGTYGDTFTIVDGKKQYTDKVAKDPTLSIMEYMWNYVSPWWIGPMLCDGEAYDLTRTPELKDAIALWVQESDAIKLPLLYFTVEEQDIIKSKMGDIDTLVAETVGRLITGELSLDKDYPDFVARVQSMGVNDVAAVYQAAYDRYLAATKQ